MAEVKDNMGEKFHATTQRENTRRKDPLRLNNLASLREIKWNRVVAAQVSDTRDDE